MAVAIKMGTTGFPIVPIFRILFHLWFRDSEWCSRSISRNRWRNSLQLVNYCTRWAEVAASSVSSPSGNGASDPKYGPVRVDSVQYKQCEGADLDFYAYGTNILLSVSNSDPACF